MKKLITRGHVKAAILAVLKFEGVLLALWFICALAALNIVACAVALLLENLCIGAYWTVKEWGE